MSERSAVQDPMLRYAQQIGWAYVPPDKALAQRGGESGPFSSALLEEQLLRLNPGVLTPALAADVLRRLRLLQPSIEGNRDALAWLRGEQSVFVPEQGRERNVRLIYFGHPDANAFHVTDEWWVKGAVFRNRADVVFLVNGIPLAVAETKSASRPDALAEGVQQVRRYHKETPELFAASQVFEVTQLHDFFYSATWATNRKDLFNWKDVEKGNYERKVKAFFDRHRFLRLLRDYVVFLARDDLLTKVILRQHQTRAVEKVLDRVADPARRRGLVWHTQGSGKTLTMLTVAGKLLRDTTGAQRPTVLMLVDRNELESQLFQNVTAYGLRTARVARSKSDLRDTLASGYRGLVVSMIHKFDDVPADLNTRADVVVLVDEAHRTTGGDLGNYLLAALPNATYIGFTGTPIDNLIRGKGTFKVFGTDDPHTGYLDKYSIAESIEDGTTVKLHYSLAPSSLRVDRDTLDSQFLGLKESEGLSDVDELNAILDRAVELKELMKSPTRVAGIAEFVADHFRSNVEPMGFKAFLVAVDREACALYKQALDRHLPPDHSAVVFSGDHNDPAALKQYHLTDDQEKKVRKSFTRRGELPKVLIVTEKLLTGFDAPILYCMYLDKPMRDHVLLQAIARVNRPYEDEEGLVKPCGFVLDFVGIFETLEKALAFDSDVVGSVIQNVDVLRKLFATWMTEKAPRYLPLTHGWDDKARERAIDSLQNKEEREEFFHFFRRLQDLYDVLSPDAFLRPFMDDYHALVELFALVRNAYSDRPYVDREVTAKTRDLLREATAAGTLDVPGAIHELGPRELAALKSSDAPDTVKVLNLRKVLARTVQEEGGAQPFLLSIGERAETIALLYEDRQLTTQKALAEFEKLASECVAAEARRRQLGLDANTFALYTSLRTLVPDLSPEQAKGLNELFTRFPEHRWDEPQKASLRAELYKALLPLVGSARLMEAANSLLRLERV